MYSRGYCARPSLRCGKHYSGFFPPQRRFAQSTPVAHDRLRILFCGSDEFSVQSLRALEEELRRPDGAISTIEVVCKAGLPSGRGLKAMRYAPAKVAALSKWSPLHQIHTFAGWTPPNPYDLIIAVSFGLKVPPRLLNAARFGGLNVHPSLLPNLRGPAPLHHTLLKGYESTGITVQTLHPEHFDQGAIIAQKKLEIPEKGQLTFFEFRDYVGPIAAELLVESLRNGSYKLPGKPQQSSEQQLCDLVHAGKITPADAQIDWSTWSSEQILRAQRALGDLWSLHSGPKSMQRQRRILWHNLKVRHVESHLTESLEILVDATHGGPQISVAREVGMSKKPGHGSVVVKSSDGVPFTPNKITVDGEASRASPVAAIKKLARAFRRHNTTT